MGANLTALVLKEGAPIHEYEPGTWGPREADGAVVPPGGWSNPTVGEAPARNVAL